MCLEMGGSGQAVAVGGSLQQLLPLGSPPVQTWRLRQVWPGARSPAAWDRHSEGVDRKRADETGGWISGDGR